MSRWSPQSAHERALSKFARGAADECWRWTGAVNHDGYGVIREGGRGTVNLRAHRVVYEVLVGPIPEGLDLDHVWARGCSSRRCVNPAHLEPVTRAENVLRGNSLPARNARKTHCPKGHRYTPGNTLRDSRGYRRCRQCRVDYRAASRVAVAA